MIYFSQMQTDTPLLGDIQGGGLTTRALGIGTQPGVMEFYHRQSERVSDTAVARQILASSGPTISDTVADGKQVNIGQRLICAYGDAAALRWGWRTAQSVLEWSCGVSGYLESMLNQLRQRYPDGQIIYTRKAIPGACLSAIQAIFAAGGIIHHGGCAETVLPFTSHRHFPTNSSGWSGAIARPRSHASEKKIVAEVDTSDEALAALHAAPDIL